jgi:lysophospholipase L1-like esterase
MTGNTPPQPRHSTRALVLYWLLVPLLIVFIPEGAVRLFRLQGDATARADPQLGWSHIPGKHGRYVSPQARASFSINSHGLVGPERAYGPAPGKRTLLLLGDSFTEAFQVPYAQSWAHLLAGNLDSNWEVLNGGVAGYGTDNELLFLRREGWRYQPDAVFLLFFTGNDVSDNDHDLSLKGGQSLSKPYFVMAGDSLRLAGSPVPGGAPVGLRSLTAWLKEHSAFYLFLRTKTYEWRARRQILKGGADQVPLHWQVYRRQATPEWEHAWKITAGLFCLLREETTRHGVPFCVGILPTGWRVDEAERKELLAKYPAMADSTLYDFTLPDRRLAAILEREGIPFVQLADPLIRAANADGGRMYSDHLNREGNRIVAQEVARLILSVTRTGAED